MKTKTKDLTGAALDWAVTKCEGLPPFSDGISWIVDREGAYVQLPKYSTDWAQGGPIIERERLCVGARYTSDQIHWDDDVLCWARTPNGSHLKYGPTPLIAAMRCFVALKLGDEIDVPDALIMTE